MGLKSSAKIRPTPSTDCQRVLKISGSGIFGVLANRFGRPTFPRVDRLSNGSTDSSTDKSTDWPTDCPTGRPTVRPTNQPTGRPTVRGPE
ncbi:PT domain-containing protein [Proteus mirabilis]|nr:PT domain-containing protein [Proteus mirabilis]